MSNETPAWFGSDERKAFRAPWDAMPTWKCVTLCALSFRKWKMARILGKSAIHAWHVKGNYELFDQLVRLSDEQWAEVLKIPFTKS